MAQTPQLPQSPQPNVLPQQQTDPLAQLRDIHMPPPIDTWPPAPGWVILAALGLAAVIALFYWLYRRWRRNRYRREALRELAALRARFEERRDKAAFLVESQTLLKRVALTRYPRERVANLTGEAWVQFLDRSANTEEFSMGAGQSLIDGGYVPDPDVDVDKLHDLAAMWIKKHRDLPPLPTSIETDAERAA